MILETKNRYQLVLEELRLLNINSVSPCYVTTNYHYSIFTYEILMNKIEAIELLKETYDNIIYNLDSVYKNYLDTYHLLDKIMKTLLNWGMKIDYNNIITNFK